MPHTYDAVHPTTSPLTEIDADNAQTSGVADESQEERGLLAESARVSTDSGRTDASDRVFALDPFSTDHSRQGSMGAFRAETGPFSLWAALRARLVEVGVIDEPQEGQTDVEMTSLPVGSAGSDSAPPSAMTATDLTISSQPERLGVLIDLNDPAVQTLLAGERDKGYELAVSEAGGDCAHCESCLTGCALGFGLTGLAILVLA